MKCAATSAAVILLLAGAEMTVQAAPVTYTLSGTGSGSLGEQAFADAPFTITAVTDTSQITSPLRGIYTVPNATATVAIAGLGVSAAFTIPTITVDNQNLSLAGLSAPDQNRAILLVASPAFATYNLVTSVGPATGSTGFNPGFAFSTAAGDFSLRAAPGATFQASVVPEPPPLALFGIGALGLVGCSWRYARKRTC